MEPPPIRCYCTCGEPMNHRGEGPRRVGWPSWMQQLLAVDFSRRCVRDRVCSTCGGAAFCVHCCREHHRGHDTAPGADGDDAAEHRRDSFCVDCCVAFCSELCAHHGNGVEGHEVIPVYEFGGRHFLQSTGSERWICIFSGTNVDLHGRGRQPGLAARPDGARRRVDVSARRRGLLQHVRQGPCLQHLRRADGDGFCGHCCGEHHRGHDTAAAAAADDEGAEEHRRDSFCIVCCVAFCSELCAHHTGGDEHEVIPVDKYGDRYFVQSTGTERWFTPAAFGGIETFEDKDGNLMVPLGPRRQRTAELIPEPGLKYATRHH